jgi:hypothetical protein
LKDLNNYGSAKLTSVNEAAHYYWYKDGVLVDLPGSEDDTVRYPTFVQGNCTGTCTGNGNYTLVTAGVDDCPSPPSVAKHIFFNNQAPLSITAPSAFAATVLSPGSIKLTWNDLSSNEGGFEIWSRKKVGTSYTKWEMRILTAANAEVFTDTQRDPSTTYQYKIRAVSNSGRSDYTPTGSGALNVTTTADTTNPSTPQNLIATATAIKTITLTWQASTDNTGIRQYRIFYGGKTLLTGSSNTTFKIENLDLNTVYSFTVKAEDLGGNLSAASNSASANTYVTGLYYEHSTGAWSKIDDIDWSFVEFSGKVNNFTLAPRTQEDYFNFKFDGYLYISTGGSYQFKTTSDDGSRVELDSVVVVNNDGIHDAKTVTGPLQTLTAGPRRITVKYFEYSASQTLSVKWKGPDTGNLWASIPDNALRSGTPPSGRAAIYDSTASASPSTSESMDVVVYPNPAVARDINVQLQKGSSANVNVKLLDFTGRPVYENNINADLLRAGVQFIPENLNDGIYILLVKQENQSVRKRIVLKK